MTALEGVVPPHIAAFCKQLRSDLNDLRFADELEPGQLVRVGGEWRVLVRFDGTSLWLVGENESEWSYPITTGEMFAWDLGAF